MKKSFCPLVLAISLLFAFTVSAFAADKVVVVPLASSALGSGDTKITLSPLNITPLVGLVNFEYSHHPMYLQMTSSFIEDELIHLPVNIPIQAAGTPLKLKHLKVCYQMSSVSDHIFRVRVNSMSDTGLGYYPYNDLTHRSSTTWKCDNLQVNPPAPASGITSLTFGITFNGSGRTMKIGSVVLTLGP